MLKNNYFSNDEKRWHKKPFITYNPRIKKDLTYILVGQCKDGVALIADTKMTIDGGADSQYGRKIFDPYGSVIMAGAGSTGHFRSFRARLHQSLHQLRNSERAKTMEAYDVKEEIIVMTEKVIHDMADDYRKQFMELDLELFLVSRFPHNVILCFNRYGMPEPVITCRAIGHGEPYGSVILKTLWKKHNPMTMSKFSQIACLILKYIKEMDLDNSVGYNEEYLPIIQHIPKIQEDMNTENSLELFAKYPVKELQPQEVQDMMESIKDEFLNLKESFDNLNL